MGCCLIFVGLFFLSLVWPPAFLVGLGILVILWGFALLGND